MSIVYRVIFQVENDNKNVQFVVLCLVIADAQGNKIFGTTIPLDVDTSERQIFETCCPGEIPVELKRASTIKHFIWQNILIVSKQTKIFIRYFKQIILYIVVYNAFEAFSLKIPSSGQSD